MAKVRGTFVAMLAFGALVVISNHATAGSRTAEKTVDNLVFLGPMVAVPANAQARSTPLSDLLAINDDLDVMCRGWSGDDPHTDEACNVRLKVEKLLEKLGYCFGKEGQSRAEATWHKCTANSNHMR